MLPYLRHVPRHVQPNDARHETRDHPTCKPATLLQPSSEVALHERFRFAVAASVCQYAHHHRLPKPRHTLGSNEEPVPAESQGNRYRTLPTDGP